MQVGIILFFFYCIHGIPVNNHLTELNQSITHLINLKIPKLIWDGFMKSITSKQDIPNSIINKLIRDTIQSESHPQVSQAFNHIWRIQSEYSALVRHYMEHWDLWLDEWNAYSQENPNQPIIPWLLNFIRKEPVNDEMMKKVDYVVNFLNSFTSEKRLYDASSTEVLLLSPYHDDLNRIKNEMDARIAFFNHAASMQRRSATYYF